MPKPSMTDPTFEHLGYANGMPLEKAREVMGRFDQCCRDHPDQVGSWTNGRGDHSHWCNRCRYSFQVDSSD